MAEVKVIPLFNTREVGNTWKPSETDATSERNLSINMHIPMGAQHDYHQSNIFWISKSKKSL
jgi:hypothetical protein